MNYRSISLIQILSAIFAVAHGNNLVGRRAKSSPDWNEAIDDFKTLVHVITFGEEIPSHHRNPLQMQILVQDSSFGLVKNPFDLPGGWFGKDNKKRGKSQSKKRKFQKISKLSKKSNMKRANSSSQLQNQQGLDDLALLNFLVQLEDSGTRSEVQMPSRKKHLASLIMAENRYKEIKKKLSITHSPSKKQGIISKPKLSNGPLLGVNSQRMKRISPNHFKGNSGSKADKQSDPKGKKWYEKIDAKGARNTLTLSVAFGIIVTALFCVLVQLFKLFANPKGSASGNSFDQINRRSTHGYDRIALDVEDDEENAQS